MVTSQQLSALGLGTNVVVDSALSSLHLQLNGRATQTAIGTQLATPATVLALPAACGDSTGTQGAVARSGTSVTETWTFTTWGCPTSLRDVMLMPVPGQPGSVTFREQRHDQPGARPDGRRDAEPG